MEVNVLNTSGTVVGSCVLNDEVFRREYNETLVHQIVVAYLANQRLGNRKQKDRSEVHYSTKKPWRQKGTGNARAGTRASPIWRGGGKTFPNSPTENFSQKVNRKMYRGAMCCVLSRLLQEDRILLLDKTTVDNNKTKNFCQMLSSLSIDSSSQNVVIIDEDFDKNFILASRNLFRVCLLNAHQLDAYNLIRSDKLIITTNAVKLVEGRLL